MREVLLAEAVATGRVTHRPGWRAEGVVWDEARRQVVGVRGHGPEGAFEVRVPFVVGDDGARSVVRADADIGLEAEPFPMEFILASVARPASLRPGEARVFLHPADWGRDGALPLVFVAPVSAHRVALVAIAPHGTFGHHERAQGGAFAEALTRTVPPDVLPIGDVPAFPQAWVRTVRPVGHAPRYWRPGLALVGDAIHPVSPVGGQGANMALADARALAAAVLGATNRGQVPPPDALARYEAARRAANDHGVAFSRRAGPVFEALQRRPWLVHGVVPALRAFNASPAAKARGLAAVSSAFASGPAGRSARPGKP